MNFDNVGPWGLFNLINDRWIVTRQAVLIFFSCTLCVAFAAPIFLGLDSAKIYSRMGPAKDFAGAIAAAGTLLLWLGMWRYWARVANHGKWAKRMWFVVLLLGFWWGSCLYFFFAYLPEIFRKRNALDQAHPPR